MQESISLWQIYSGGTKGVRISLPPGQSPKARSQRASQWLRVLVSLIAILLAASSLLETALADDFLEGRVVAVFDGDTIEVLVDSTRQRIRIAGIDTPERGQPWGSRSKEALSSRVFGKEVRINAIAVDRYGRTIGEIYADNVCVGCELVREGHAWVYRHFTDDAILFELEREAREERRGLWSLPESERTPPWEWRHQKKQKARRPDRSQERAEGPLECGSKARCSEMATCDEARFHLEQCGLEGLDGDKDGVPCETLCSGR